MAFSVSAGYQLARLISTQIGVTLGKFLNRHRSQDPEARFKVQMTWRLEVSLLFENNACWTCIVESVVIPV